MKKNLTNILGDERAFWNHLLWAKQSLKTKTKDNRNAINFIKLAPSTTMTGTTLNTNNNAGSTIEATFDNNFSYVVLGERQGDGTYVFTFGDNFDTAKFDNKTMTLRFTSGAIWFPLFNNIDNDYDNHKNDNNTKIKNQKQYEQQPIKKNKQFGGFYEGIDNGTDKDILAHVEHLYHPSSSFSSHGLPPLQSNVQLLKRDVNSFVNSKSRGNLIRDYKTVDHTYKLAPINQEKTIFPQLRTLTETENGLYWVGGGLILAICIFVFYVTNRTSRRKTKRAYN